jgi:hypothetical protein
MKEHAQHHRKNRQCTKQLLIPATIHIKQATEVFAKISISIAVIRTTASFPFRIIILVIVLVLVTIVDGLPDTLVM